MDPMEQEISDQALIQEIRKRLLDEIRGGKRGGDAERIVNNIYGGGVAGSGSPMQGGGGVMDRMGGPGEMSPEDHDYFVDILRQDIGEGGQADFVDPTTGQPTSQAMPQGGWRKRVHRFSVPKKKMMEDQG